MSEQPLQCMEIDTGFEQVSGKAVAQHVDAAGLIDLGAALGLREGLFDARGAQRASAIPAGKEVLTRPGTSPVVAQLFEQMWREKGQSVLGTLALFDADQHATRVDVGGPVPEDFAHPQAGRVGGQEERSMFEKRGARQESSHLVATEYIGELAWLSGHRNIEVAFENWRVWNVGSSASFSNAPS